MDIRKWQDKAKIIVTPKKAHAMTTRKPNICMHVPCIHKPTRKSHVQPITWNSSCWSCLIQVCLSCTFSFLVLRLPFFSCLFDSSSWFSSLPQTNFKAKLTKNMTKTCELILIKLFITDATIFFIFRYFPPIFLSCKLMTLHIPFILFSFIFINKIPLPFLMPFPISLPIINRKWHPPKCFFQHSTWYVCPMTLVVFFL